MNERYLGHIHRVVAALSHRLTPEDLADALVRELASALNASAASVFVLDPQRTRLQLVRAIGYSQEALDRWLAQPIDDTPVLRAARDQGPAFTRSRVEDARFDQSLRKELGDGAGLVVALRASGRLLGFLGVSFDHVREFDEAEREFILTLASHCAQSLERAWLFEAERVARAAADAARRQLETVLHQLPVAVSIVHRDGSVVLNEKVQAIYGVNFRTAKREDYAGARAKIRHPDGTPCADGDIPIARALAGEAVSGEELVITRVDGAERQVRVWAAPVREDDGQIRTAVAAFHDVTDETKIAEELRASERRYLGVLRATNDVIWEIVPATGRVTWNGELERQFGWRPEDSMQHPEGVFAWWAAQIHPDDCQRVVEGYERAASGSDDSWAGEYRFRRADGSYVPTLDRCVFERDVSGKVVRVVGAMSDVSEQHRLLHELRDAVRVRDDFLSIAGHELRTPLAALSAQLLGLRRLPLDEEGREHKLSAADRQVRRLNTLVDELLNVSRIINGKLQLERESLDLGVVVAEVVARSQDDFQRSGTALDVQVSSPAAGRWDRLRIDLVVTNLLSNALRYARKRPVRVRVQADERVARVIVEDEGIGIKPEDHERIFERFTRAGLSRELGGLGVGLWLSRQIVDAHGGRLTVESREGEGARFTMELPVA